MSALNDTLNEIREVSLELYRNHSLVSEICTLNEETQKPDFKIFQRQTQLNRLELENGQIVRPDNMVHGLVNDELDYIINSIQNDVETTENSGELPQTIANATHQLSDNYEPDRIIIPRDFTSKIPEWNRLLDQNASDDFFTLRLGHPLRVIRFPLNYPFSNIVILCKNSIEYDFVQGIDNTRLQLGLEVERGIQFPFWVRTIGKIQNLHNDRIKIIRP